uniref:Lipocalin/cytosolic fatty-acid binding domain-containing protein n=1 Tax=Amblyomma maculatum TaxID=34609 RepID=G3MQD0_AMBMU
MSVFTALIFGITGGMGIIFSDSLGDSTLASKEEAYQHEDPTEILQSRENMVLFRTTYYKSPYASRCMKLKFTRNSADLFLRTIEYWGFEHNNGVPTTFAKYTIEVKLTLNKTLGRQPVVRAESNKQGKLEAQSWEYPILFADGDCAITGEYGNGGAGERDCMLWVKQSMIHNPPKHCNFLLLSMCGTDVYNAYTHDKLYCEEFEKRLHKSSR